jgi:hypothetical protein
MLNNPSDLINVAQTQELLIELRQDKIGIQNTLRWVKKNLVLYDENNPQKECDYKMFSQYYIISKESVIKKFEELNNKNK